MFRHSSAGWLVAAEHDQRAGTWFGTYEKHKTVSHERAYRVGLADIFRHDQVVTHTRITQVVANFLGFRTNIPCPHQLPLQPAAPMLTDADRLVRRCDPDYFSKLLLLF